jgi:MarR family transcriptional regulator for hemolysin
MSSDDSTEMFGQLVHGTARAWRQKLDERLKPMGLSQAKWRTLMHLSLAGDALTQAEIAARLGVEEPTVVNLMHRLERESWITRKNSPHDRRCKMVLLGRRAQRVIAEINATAAKLRHELLAGIPSGDVATCMQVLGRIQERAEKSDRRQPTPCRRPPRDSLECNGHTKQRHSITRKGAISRRAGGFK